MRWSYAALVVAAQFDPTRRLSWMLPVGTVMVTLFDRCFIARILVHMPWKRDVRLV